MKRILNRIIIICSLLITVMGCDSIYISEKDISDSDTESEIDSEDETEISDGFAVSWSTDTASLYAEDFYIEINGIFYTAKDIDVDVDGDPGWDTYQSLELVWYENSKEMRLFFYFTADETHWWCDEIRTYDGTEVGDWLIYTGDFFKCELGTTYVGDLDEYNDSSDGMVGHLYFENLNLIAFQ